MIDRLDLARLVPHAGEMSFLDAVVEWGHERIVCHSTRHAAIDNPLRLDNRLSAVHAIEFAAQAMAAHRRLIGKSGPDRRYGLLVSVRECSFAADRLDLCVSPLVIEATQVAASPEAFTYRFAVGAAGSPIAHGRASVALIAGSTP
jgi:predicted hotdog family 3-hydroxylacyl-ACP dehydratase